MRKKQKENLLELIRSGNAKCDCDSPATRIDEAGKPECQICHDRNEMAMHFHERTRKEIEVQNWEMNWA